MAESLTGARGLDGLFEGETALVTGSASNIGRGIARGLAAEGAHVVLADINPARNDETAETIRADGGACTTVTADLSQPDGWRVLLPVFDDRLPSMFVHSACPPRSEADTPRVVGEETFDAMLTVGVRSGFLIGRELGRRMVEAGTGGRMLYITSLHSSTHYQD